MFGKKKKEPQDGEPLLTEKELSDQIGQQAGLLPEEMLKLFDSLERVEKSRKVLRQKSEGDKIVKGKQMSLAEAVEYAKERLEEHKRREEILRKVKRHKKLKYFEVESRDVIEDEEYPRRLSPYDIGQSIESARRRLLEEEERRKFQQDPVNKKAEMLLRVLDKMKVSEAARVAKMIARRQNVIRVLSLEEAERKRREAEANPQPEISEEIAEHIELTKTLHGFGKGLNTLIDDANEVVKDDLDAAASVVRQWVGTIHEENK